MSNAGTPRYQESLIMRIGLQLLLLVSIFIFFYSPVQGQQYPVTVSLRMTPPYSLRLSDYADAGADRIGANVLLQDITQPDYRVYLVLRIKGDGVLVETASTYRPVVSLSGGIPQVLTAADLAGYFDLRNLRFSGYSKRDYQRRTLLPEGFYEISLEAYDFQKNVRVSKSIPVMAWLQLSDPPLLAFPHEGQKVQATFPQQVLFSWQPRHVGSPNAGFTTAYELSLVEVMPEGRNPQHAMESTLPFYNEVTYESQFRYDFSCPQLTPGRTYAYRVRAYDAQGRDMFRNKGYSETGWFVYGEPCDTLQHVEVETLRYNTINVRWQPQPNHQFFNVRYRCKGDGWQWLEEETALTDLKLTDLEAEKTYQVQVQGVCGTLTSEYTTPKTITTPAFDPPEFSCGVGGDLPPIENLEPLELLENGDFVEAHGFQIKVINVEGSGGSFSGDGFALVPYLSFAKIPVEFKGIQVNTDYQLTGGEVVTKYYENSSFVADVGDLNLDFGMDADDEEEAWAPADTLVLDSINDVTIEEGQIKIITESDTVYQPIQDVLIVGTEGKTWAVNAGEGTINGKSPDGGDGFSGGDGGGMLAGGSENPPDPLVLSDTTKLDQVLVLFSAGSGGFDELREGYPESMFPHAEIQGKNQTLSWFAAQTGIPRTVLAHVGSLPEGLGASNIGFRTLEGAEVPAQPMDDTLQRKLTVNAYGGTGTTSIEAYIPYKTVDGKERIRVVGRLEVAMYTPRQKQLRVVPMSPELSGKAATLKEDIQKIYGITAINWDVRVIEGFSPKVKVWDRDENGKISVKKQLMGKYSREMKRIYKAFDKEMGLEDETFYLFLSDAALDTSVVAYMPLKSNVGFMSAREIADGDLGRVAAHELGHGAFHLWHTFSKKHDPILSRATTDNLMDYNNGSRLNKAQWDLIHDPEGGLYVFQDEEEGAMKSPGLKVLIDRIKDANLKKKYKIDFNDYLTGTDKKSIVYLQQTIKLPDIEIPVGAALRVFSKEDLNQLITNLYEQVEYKTTGVVGNVKGGFTYRLDFTYSDQEAVLKEGNYDKPTIALELFIKEEHYEDLRKYLFGELKPIIEQVITDDKHVKQAPGDCLNACEDIIKNAGYKHDRLNVLVLANNVNGNEFEFHQECVTKSVEVIDEHIENGIPITVGVNYKDGSANFDKVTDHWIVITARGNDENGVFYNYFEVAREMDKGGITKDNKLYLQSTGVLKGKCTCNRKYDTYLVTMVRPTGDFNFKCCGREIYKNDSERWKVWKKYCEECKEDPGYYNKMDELHNNRISKP